MLHCRSRLFRVIGKLTFYKDRQGLALASGLASIKLDDQDTQTHRHTDTQTHRHTDTQTHRHTRTNAHTMQKYIIRSITLLCFCLALICIQCVQAQTDVAGSPSIVGDLPAIATAGAHSITPNGCSHATIVKRDHVEIWERKPEGWVCVSRSRCSTRL